MKAVTYPRHRTERRHWRGVLQIVRFNWPFYVTGTLVLLVCIAGAVLVSGVAHALAITTAAAVGYWIAASLWASHLVYDRSPLMRWEWIRDYVDAGATRAANLHAGLDESSDQLRRIFPRADWRVWDFYDPVCMTEPSIRRARQSTGGPPAERVRTGELPAEDGTLDAAFLIFSAHELRTRVSRESLFRELHRVMRPGGTLLIVEHLRDLANFLAYGPGFFHFLGRAEWLRLAGGAGFKMTCETRVTPFVGVFVLRRTTQGRSLLDQAIIGCSGRCGGVGESQ
jgi:SAM-dependent methyltransferase